MSNNQHLFSDFTNLYPVSKTLRFELIPQKETLEFIEKNDIIDKDRKRVEDSKILKNMMDEYYKVYIDEVLSDVHLEGLNKYESLFNIKAKTEDESDEFKKCQQELRNQIHKAFEEFKKDDQDACYKDLLKKEMVAKKLPEFFAEDNEKLEIVKSFKGFTTIFTNFWKNRENMFSADCKMKLNI
jgi:CRISPR-associated protein Cpf1